MAARKSQFLKAQSRTSASLVEPRAGAGLFFGYTLVELLATIAALAILLSAMVSLSRHVRASSAIDLTKDLLRRLDEAMALYVQQNDHLSLGVPELITDGGSIQEQPLAARAQANNQAVVRLLKAAHVLPVQRFDDLSIAYYDGFTVRDAWGSPIVFMDRMHPAIGMAAKGWFFFSAGPDRAYTTKSDNLYSYEVQNIQ
jgi:prepilin-type N-terminal cleavage/methylation domain-containing protein